MPLVNLLLGREWDHHDQLRLIREDNVEFWWQSLSQEGCEWLSEIVCVWFGLVLLLKKED